MSQHDMDLSNQSGAAFRADANLALKALASLNLGGSAPSTTFAGMLWFDSTANRLKLRNESNTAWVILPFNTGVQGRFDENVEFTQDINLSGTVINLSSGGTPLPITIGSLGSGIYSLQTGSGFLDLQTNGLITAGYHTPGTQAMAFQGMTSSATLCALHLESTNSSFTGEAMKINVQRSTSSLFDFLVCHSDTQVSDDRQFQLRGDGNAYCDGSWNGGGADYAEMFEWDDGNPLDDDRAGMSVAHAGDGMIRVAKEGDDPIGVVSVRPAFLAGTEEFGWADRYLRDDFGRVQFGRVEFLEFTEEQLRGDKLVEVKVRRRAAEPNDAPEGARSLHREAPLRNPAYDPNKRYTPREQRPEWCAVGVTGRLMVREGQVVGSRWLKLRAVSPTVDEYLVR